MESGSSPTIISRRGRILLFSCWLIPTGFSRTTPPERKPYFATVLPGARTEQRNAPHLTSGTALFGGTAPARSASKTRRSGRDAGRPSRASCHHHPMKLRYLLTRRRAPSVSRLRWLARSDVVAGRGRCELIHSTRKVGRKGEWRVASGQRQSYQ